MQLMTIKMRRLGVILKLKTILVIQRPPYIHFLLMFDMNTPDIQKHVWNVTIAICQINVNNIYV